jgi:hypothetical protein
MATVFDPGPAAIRIQYLNFRGQQKTFTGDRTTLRAKGKHVSLRLAPTGRRVTFSKECIQNFAEVEAALGQVPVLTAVETQIASYYKKHGGTSPRLEALRRKYPHL